jgi:O-antigen ligase
MRRKTLAVALALVLSGVLLVAAPSRMTEFDSAETSANERFLFWKFGFNQLRAYPLTGVGFRRFTEVNPRRKTSHNSFVQCFSELGLPGYFFWMGCLYYAFRQRPGKVPPDQLPLLNPEQQRESPDRPVPPALAEAVATDVIGARLGLMGFLVAVFWLSRTYVENTWLFIALTVAAQLVAGTGVVRLNGKERFNDWARILGLCFGSILFIKLMADYYTR